MIAHRIALVLRIIHDPHTCDTCGAYLLPGARAWVWRRAGREKAACEGHLAEVVGKERAA